MLETPETQKQEEKKVDKLVGTVDRVLFRNQDNGYHVLSVEMNTDKDITVTINHPNIFEGFTYEFAGEYAVHAKFGNQFKATSAHEVLPSTSEGLKAYLSSSFFPGIGPVIANRVIDHFGENVIEVFNKDLNKLLSVPGISQRKLEAIKASWEKNKEINDVMMFLKQFNISNLYAKKIYEFYGSNCVSKILTNPYRLAKDISGIGFLYADKVGVQAGFDLDGMERIQACINFILDQGANDGHCYLYENQITAKSTELLKTDLKGKVTEALDILDRMDEIKSVIATGDKNKRYYSRKLYYNEKYCAEKIHLLKENTAKVEVHESLFDKIKDDIILSDEQKSSVLGIIGKGVSVLTGGPGSGKCLKKGTEVLMYNGVKKKIEDIVIGDLLMGDDSTPRKVLSLARGKERMYDIMSNDKKEWGCNESHILSLYYNDSRNTIINGKKYKKGDIIDISVKDYLKLSDRKRHHLKQFSTKVEYREKRVIIPPYLLGLWLGDGGSKDSRITNTDEELYVYAENISKSLELKYVKSNNKNRTNSFKLSGVRNKSFASLLKKYNLWDNKHIPKDYSINSEKTRLELLAGLVDTDGCLGKQGGNFEISFVNKELAYDTYDVSLSLGFRCTINKKIATLKRKDGSVYKVDAYRIIIGGDLNRIPTKIKRKIANNNPNKNPMSSGFTLTDKGIGEYYGFEIDGNKRFILGNYVVTHNTTTTKKLVRLLLQLGYDIVLAAPTGRASQRMTEVIGYQASTIHRLLVWDHENKAFLKNEKNTLNADFIIIDESSMVDINLAASLLKAISPTSQILFIGDSDQLPPVGPGDFFRDLITSNIVPVFRLNQIFRQGKESLIIKYSYEINNQKMPTIDTPLMNPELWKDGTDCLFVDSGVPEPHKRKEEYPKWSSLRYELDFINMITKLYTESIPKYIGKDKEIQILMPMNIGDFGTIKVNQVIQGIVNPASDKKREIKIKERVLRDGDKVIQTKNNYDLEVFNGDIGKIITIDKEKTEITVKFSEEREVIYAKSDILELDLAYAISIHKSQGSEFDCVILPLMMGHYRMLYKQLIYTGLTRAKKFAVFVGQRKALEIAVKNSNAQIRQTSLRTMLLDENLVSPV